MINDVFTFGFYNGWNLKLDIACWYCTVYKAMCKNPTRIKITNFFFRLHNNAYSTTTVIERIMRIENRFKSIFFFFSFWNFIDDSKTYAGIGNPRRNNSRRKSRECPQTLPGRGSAAYHNLGESNFRRLSSLFVGHPAPRTRPKGTVAYVWKYIEQMEKKKNTEKKN